MNDAREVFSWTQFLEEGDSVFIYFLSSFQKVSQPSPILDRWRRRIDISLKRHVSKPVLQNQARFVWQECLRKQRDDPNTSGADPQNPNPSQSVSRPARQREQLLRFRDDQEKKDDLMAAGED